MRDIRSLLLIQVGTIGSGLLRNGEDSSGIKLEDINRDTMLATLVGGC